MPKTQSSSVSPAPLWVWVVAVLSVFMCAVGIIAVAVRPDVDKDFTSEADGVVYRVEKKTRTHKKRNSTSYITHVRFTDSDGQTFEAQSVVNGSWRRHEEGDLVTVRYDPRNPTSGVLIKGDEDKLGEFNAFVTICREGCFIGFGACFIRLGLAKFGFGTKQRE